MSHFAYSVDDLSVYPTFNDADLWPVETLAPDRDHADETADASNVGAQNSQNFDERLQKLWNDADKKQLFRYSLRNVPTKIVSDKFQFVLQLNPERATKRRAPQEIQHVNQPFSPDEFNFNKVKSEETILTLTPLDHSSSTSPQTQKTHTRICSVTINVSPLEYCHVLLVPDPAQNQPQAITIDGLKSAVEVLLLSHSCDFRVGFNSLCGFASVNHHHYHAYYLKHRLYIEYAELKHVAGPCHEFKDSDYPAPGFVFILTDLKELHSFLQSCFRLISYLQGNDIAHNVYATRGSSQSIKNYFDCIRLIVWGRASSFGSKVCHAFNPALCELAGHFPLKNEESYSTMTEEFIFNELRGICQSTFEQVKAQVDVLWRKDCKNENNEEFVNPAK